MTARLKIVNSKFLHIILTYIFPFTIIFLFLQFIVFYDFLKEGKSFVWYVDGINQHYPALKYFGQMLKDLINGNGFKMIDFNIGMGFDTLTTLNYYAIGDPLTLLTVFANSDNMEVIYKILIIIRLYLAGISFILFCLTMKKKALPSTFGAMIYVFCGYSLYASVRHPYFTNPMIYLPLLLIGLEFYFRKKKPYLFVIMTFVSAISNFYFFYMLTIIIFIYAVIHFFSLYKDMGKKEFYQLLIKTASKVIIYYLLGVAMAAILFLPVIAAFLNNGRFDSGYSVNLIHYAIRFYVLLGYSFLAASSTGGYWTHLTYVALTVVSVYLVFKNKKYRELLIGFILLTLCLMLPIIGYTMNGFSYVSNRWVFGYSLLISYIFVSAYEEMFELNIRDRIILIAGAFIYGIGCMLCPEIYGLIATILLFLSLAVILFFNHFKKFHKYRDMVIFILIFCNLSINGYLTYDSKFGNYVEEFIDSGKVQETINNSAVQEISKIEDNSFFRVETFGDKKLNESLTNGYNDVSGYFSIMDKRVSEYMKGLEVVSQKMAYRFDNLDYRLYTSTLAGVKYLVTSNKNIAPYGYAKIAQSQSNLKTYYTFENQKSLSLGYTYNQYVTRDVYENLTALQKQELLLQAVVLEKPIANFYSIKQEFLTGNKKNAYFNEKELKADCKFSNGIVLEGDTLKVTKEGANIKLYFQGIPNTETYVRLKNFNINDTVYYSLNFKIKGEGGVTKVVNVRPDWNSTYFGKQNYLVNLGYQKKGMNYAEITFSNIGDFHLEDLEVFALPMDRYDNLIQARAEGSLEDIKMENNKITAVSNAKEDEILCLAIPYSKGWTAYVNGVKTKLLQANVMYMAIPIKSGNNTIELHYETPFLRAGAAISGIGWFFFLSMIIINRIKGLSKNKYI